MQKKILIGKVYANWCGHCQSLKPEWLKMKKKLNTKMGYIIEFVEIEESHQRKLAKFKQRYPKLNVRGYPTIFKISGGNNHLEYYQGDRTAQSMVDWALGQNQNNKTVKNSDFFMGGKKKSEKRNKTKRSKTSKSKRKSSNSKTMKNMVSKVKSFFSFGK